MLSIKSMTIISLVGVMSTSIYALPASHAPVGSRMTPVTVAVKSRDHLRIPRGATISFTLWGVDAQLADHGATRLATYRYPLNALPASYRLPIDRGLSQRIQPQSRGGHYKYYLTTEVRSAGKREFAVTDFGKSGPVFADSYRGLQQTILLKRKDR